MPCCAHQPCCALLCPPALLCPAVPAPKELGLPAKRFDNPTTSARSLATTSREMLPPALGVEAPELPRLLPSLRHEDGAGGGRARKVDGWEDGWGHAQLPPVCWGSPGERGAWRRQARGALCSARAGRGLQRRVIAMGRVGLHSSSRVGRRKSAAQPSGQRSDRSQAGSAQSATGGPGLLTRCALAALGSASPTFVAESRRAGAGRCEASNAAWCTDSSGGIKYTCAARRGSRVVCLRGFLAAAAHPAAQPAPASAAAPGPPRRGPA
jgi:hypothetical protein